MAVMPGEADKPAHFDDALTVGRRALVRRIGLLAVAAAAGVSGSVLYVGVTRPTSMPVTRTAQGRALVVPLKSAYGTEEDWLVSVIVGDLSDMVEFAGNGPDRLSHVKVAINRDPLGQVVTTVTSARGDTVRVPLLLEHSTWSAEDYVALASDLMKTFGVRPAPAGSSEDDTLLWRLLDLRADVIETENEDLSSELEKHPADPRLHEDAALILGAFALREAAVHFADSRHVLCRMTAHLAFARALRASAPLGASGRLAEAFLATLAERGADAEARIERLHAERTSAAQDAWCRVLMLRITEDWRTVGAVRNASMAEQLGWLRAAERTVGPARAHQMMEQAGLVPGPEPDWALILSRRPRVEVGNIYLDEGLTALLDESQGIWSRIHGKALPSSARIAALNEPAQPFLAKDGPRVIAWGTWAAMYQRHVLHLLRQTEYYRRHLLDLEESADRLVSEATATFSGLTLFPLLGAYWEAERDEPDPLVLDRAVDFVVKNPELTTFAFWWGIEAKTSRQALPRKIPPRATWFTTGSVRGTTFDIGIRGGPGLPTLSTADALNRLKQISPRSYDIAVYRVRAKDGTAPTMEAAIAEFGKRLEYDSDALAWLQQRAQEEDPASVLPLIRRRVELDPDMAQRLGDICLEQGDEACAVGAYETMIREAPDRVRAANSSRWLMNYYLRHGRRAEARAIAEMAAAVGSAGGLLTMAAFHEVTGGYEQAEGYIRRACERYPRLEDAELIGFYYRMGAVRGVERYADMFAASAKDVFPLGLQTAKLDSFTAPPEDGAVFTTESSSLRRAGLRKGDVVVAFDGWRVRDFRQYMIIRSFDDDPVFRLIVWHSGSYLEVRAYRPTRLFGVEMAAYKPSPAGRPNRP